MKVTTNVFSEPGDFAALNEAEDFLRERGFSVGSSQRGAHRGIMFGDYGISKWRNLSKQEQAELHGVIRVGDHRYGPVYVDLYETAPAEAHDAWHKVMP